MFNNKISTDSQCFLRNVEEEETEFQHIPRMHHPIAMFRNSKQECEAKHMEPKKQEYKMWNAENIVGQENGNSLAQLGSEQNK